MDSFELNKIVGGLLAAVFVVFSIGLISDAIFHEEVPEQAGYVIEAAEEGEGGDASGGEAETVSIAALMADADPAAGESVFKKCAACHTIESGGANKVGPNLHGVVGRAIAGHEGFSYSEALKTYGGEVGEWDFEHLNAFLLKPKDEVPGTAMGFAGLKKDSDRANLIAWMNEQSDSPLPLPEPEAESDEGGEPAADAAEADGQPQAEGAADAEGTGDPDGAEPAETTTEAAPSSETAPADTPTAVEGTGEPLDGSAETGEEGSAADEPAASGDAAATESDATGAEASTATEAEPAAETDSSSETPTDADGEPLTEEELLRRRQAN
ncbi:c-type cytochrome [Notoacmeibacter sp. MSK16QG-6]|uniref:c-type cytochrome n=1 Tax=Notoacmeibacter sp. MSK16QG-6 TaxID=2957982 RepID=UPI00209F739B|nr:c-type cytochrome [Notoacmeibacter sp. MSK16QG-6]MCP1198747.1 c-type cytochrome [Notoacmeibacter sp. MSK16QG-6]